MITLQSIKNKQDEISAMIAAFEAYSGDKISYPAITLDLQPGEKNAGLVLGKDGDADYFLILLPEEKENIDWNDAVKWAKQQGGDMDASLPTRREQALLYANLNEEFKNEYYWSSEQHASESGYAWYQYFYYGYQGYYGEGDTLRARAVRRLLCTTTC
jgi:hypothetical protein